LDGDYYYYLKKKKKKKGNLAESGFFFCSAFIPWSNWSTNFVSNHHWEIFFLFLFLFFSGYATFKLDLLGMSPC
jgi:hypothetical protein